MGARLHAPSHCNHCVFVPLAILAILEMLPTIGDVTKFRGISVSRFSYDGALSTGVSCYRASLPVVRI